MQSLRIVCLVSAVALAGAFAPTSSFTHNALARQAPAISAAQPALSLRKSSVRAARPLALSMQSEDDKAKAAGVAAAVVGLIVGKFSLLVGVLFGGAAVYAAKLPEEGDKGLSDTAKQVSLLIGEYSLKLFDFAKEKDAESGFTSKLTDKVKDAVEDVKSNIKQG